MHTQLKKIIAVNLWEVVSVCGDGLVDKSTSYTQMRV